MAPWASLAYKDNKSENLASKLPDGLGCKYKVANSNDADVCLRNASSYDLLDAVE